MSDLDAYWESQIAAQMQKQKAEERKVMLDDVVKRTTCAKCGQSNQYHIEDVCKETVEAEEEARRTGKKMPSEMEEHRIDFDDFVEKMRGAMKPDDADEPVTDKLCPVCGQELNNHIQSICNAAFEKKMGDGINVFQKKPDPATQRMHPVTRIVKKRGKRNKKK